jgi:hypothetical protein
MYPPNSPVVDQMAQRATQQVEQLCMNWRVNREIGQDIVKLALFDIILYIGAFVRPMMGMVTNFL